MSASATASAPAPDLCVIGAGPAGLSAAFAAAALGVSTLVIERETTGGARLAVGSVPFAPWRLAAREGDPPNWARLALRVRESRRRAAAAGAPERLKAAGIGLIAGQARFVSPREIEVAGARIAARAFVVATGRVPVRPSAPGLELIRGLDLAEFLELAHPPRAVAVIGAGATGLGLAQTLARLGVAVTVVDRGPALAEWPRELADPALRRIRAEGVRVLEHVEIVEAVPLGAGAKLILSSGERVEAPHLVYAVGWRPATEGLGLETAGVAVGPSGVATRADLRTRARRIYAAGEIVAGAPADAAAAARMGALAARSALLGLKGEARLALEPRFARLDPPIATVGLDETQARAAGIKGLRVLRATLGESETARASGRGEGHVALLIDRRGRLLGAGLVGQGAEAAAPLLAQAIARRLDMAALAALPMPDLDIFAAIARAASVELARLARAPAAARLLKLRRLWR